MPARRRLERGGELRICTCRAKAGSDLVHQGQELLGLHNVGACEPLLLPHAPTVHHLALALTQQTDPESSSAQYPPMQAVRVPILH